MNKIKKLNSGLYFKSIFWVNKIDYYVKTWQLEKIAKDIYICAINKEEKNSIIKTKIFDLLNYLFPECYLSDSSAIYFRAINNMIFLRWPKEKKIKIWDFTIFINKQEKYTGELKPFIWNYKLKIANLELAILENCAESKFIIERIAKDNDLIMYIRSQINNIDLTKIDLISANNNLKSAKIRFFEIYWKLKGSKPIKEEKEDLVFKHLKNWNEIDLKRIEKFTILSHYLNTIRPLKNTENSFKFTGYSYNNYCFYDSYFSNYIEWSRLEYDEARDIIENKQIKVKPKDSHSMLDHYKFINKFYKLIRTFSEIGNPEEFIDFIKTIHKNITLNSLNSCWNLKIRWNRVWTYIFVSPDKVEATLKEGFIIWQKIKGSFEKALYYHFLISEVHPFEDWNGRVARIILNYYLIKDFFHPLIVTEKYRDFYKFWLKELSLNDSPESYYQFFQLCKERMENTDFMIERLFEDELEEEIWETKWFFDIFK